MTPFEAYFLFGPLIPLAAGLIIFWLGNRRTRRYDEAYRERRPS